MFGRNALYNNNPILQWLWKHGWEEPVGPHGPFAQGAERFAPQPEPWRVAVPQLIEAVRARDLAMRLDDRQRSDVMKSATSAITAIIDDWCGTPPRRLPWPWPGPPPWTWEIASELSLVAHSLEEGSLRQGLLDAARQVVETAGRSG